MTFKTCRVSSSSLKLSFVEETTTAALINYALTEARTHIHHNGHQDKLDIRKEKEAGQAVNNKRRLCVCAGRTCPWEGQGKTPRTSCLPASLPGTQFLTARDAHHYGWPGRPGACPHLPRLESQACAAGSGFYVHGGDPLTSSCQRKTCHPAATPAPQSTVKYASLLWGILWGMRTKGLQQQNPRSL